MRLDPLNKFYEKTRPEKIQALKEAGFISKETAETWEKDPQAFNLGFEKGGALVENHVDNYDLPYGLAMNFLVDGKDYVLPMVTEEPSVIAAASNAGKMTRQGGGFQTEADAGLMIGQVAFTDLKDPASSQERILENKEKIIDLANAAKPSMAARGGGALDLDVRLQEDFLVVHLLIDTQEAMGANTVNTMAEGITPYLKEIVEGRHVMSILSNYATESLVTARCRVPLESLETDTLSGADVRDEIILASKFAQADPYRAATHNKGIMNGIDALIIASGNDWRAVEAGAHAYAARDGHYRGLSTWERDSDGALVGSLTLPLALGTVGGSIKVHPLAQVTQEILDYPTADELARLVASLGLGQNLAALKALTTEGIQRGHMELHMQSLALSVGAQGEEIEKLSSALQQSDHADEDTAIRILNKIRNS